MSDPRSIVPYHDPHDSPINLEYFDFIMDAANPTLDNLSSLNQQQPTSTQHPPSSTDYIADPNNPFDDPIIWNLTSTHATQSQEAGPSTQNYSNVGDADNADVKSRCSDDGMPLTIWPPPLAPYQCTCCQVLREIIHTDGNCTSILEIHGRLGIICHAVLENRGNVITGSSETQYRMIDFCKKSIANVKEFLKQYCEDKKKAGFVLVKDPLSIFYEALCVGFEWDENMNNNNDYFDPSPSTFSGVPQGDQTEGWNEAERVTRTTLAHQRARTGKMTLKDFVAYFHLPIEEAARRMNLCPTVVKKICRRYGMNRWPHRKIKSLQRQISILRPAAKSNNAEERERALAEIHKLQQEISKYCTVPTD